MNNTIGVSTRPIPIQSCEISGQQISSVNARELHEFLGVETRFDDWIRRRIKYYQFEKNRDFIVFLKNEENPQGGRPTKDYQITIDMAKELSMVERTDKGRQARRYFIECERIAKEKIIPKKSPEIPSQTILEKAFQLIEDYKIELAHLRHEREQFQKLHFIGSSTNPIVIEDNSDLGDFQCMYKGYHVKVFGQSEPQGET